MPWAAIGTAWPFIAKGFGEHFPTTFFSWKLAAGYWALEKMVVDSSARESQAVHFCSMSGSGGWP
jgi:hypothetical protein